MGEQVHQIKQHQIEEIHYKKILYAYCTYVRAWAYVLQPLVHVQYIQYSVIFPHFVLDQVKDHEIKKQSDTSPSSRILSQEPK